MSKKNFLLVSLEDKQSKQLAEVLNNPTSRKIIDFLSEHEDATESQISKTLSIPLSTVHYNLQKLKEAQLVNVEEFHYSKKGREVDHYKLANKYVIITPKPVKGIKTALRSILPVGLIVLGIAAIIQFAQSFTSKAAFTSVKEVAQASLDAELVAEAAPQVAQVMADTASSDPNIALWFLIGGFTAIVVLMIINLVMRNYKK
jgi:predicted ArsR family transcriptional regulator